MEPLLQKAVQVIVNPILQVAFAVATILFAYGIFEFIKNTDNPEARKTGQQHMLWGVIGLAIMVAVFTIMRILINTLGANVPGVLIGQ